MIRANRKAGITTHENALKRAMVFAKKTGDTKLLKSVEDAMSEEQLKKMRGLRGRVAEYFCNLNHLAYKEDTSKISSRHTFTKDHNDHMGYLIRKKLGIEGYKDRKFVNNLLEQIIKDENFKLVPLFLKEVDNVNALDRSMIERKLYNELEEKLTKNEQKEQLEFALERRGIGNYEKYLPILEIDNPKERMEKIDKIFNWNSGSIEEGVVANISEDKSKIIAYNGYSFIFEDINTGWEEDIVINLNSKSINVSSYHSWHGDYTWHGRKSSGSHGTWHKDRLEDKKWIFPISENFSLFDYDDVTTKMELERLEKEREKQKLERGIQEANIRYVNNMAGRRHVPGRRHPSRI